MVNDAVDIVSSPVMQAEFAQVRVHKPTISECTTCSWLSGKLGWCYGRHKNRMYVDGHERRDVVEYREHFAEQFKEYKRWFHTWDDVGIESLPSGFPVPRAIRCFHLVLITHDESTFYQNDQCNVHWGCPGRNNTLKPKGEGTSLMVQTFSLQTGAICMMPTGACFYPFPSQIYSHSPSKVCFILKPGKNREGWFTANHLLQ